MEETQASIKKTSLNYGLLLGLISIVFSLMLYFMDLHLQQNPVITIVGVLISVAIIFLGIYNFKKANGGFLTLKEGLKAGFGITFVSAIIMLIYNLVFAYGIEPEFATQVMEMKKAEMMESGKMTTEQINQQVEMSIKYFWMGYLVFFVLGLLIGFIISLISGLILKKAKSTY